MSASSTPSSARAAMSMRNILILMSLSLVLTGCARREAEPVVEPAATVDTPAVAPGAVLDQPKVVAPIQVTIDLSPDAKAQLASRSESLILDVYFAGDPTAESQAQVNELGLVELGRTSQELPGAGTVGFDESAIDSSRLGLIVGQPQVILSVRSTTRGGADSLVACPMYWDSVKVASERPVKILCTTISESAAQ